MRTLLFISLVIFASCGKPVDTTTTVSYLPPPHLVASLKSPFEPLSTDERASDWGRELVIGQHLGKEQDLFGAVTAFKRARILASLSPSHIDRNNEIEYDLLLAYYLANKYSTVCETFENSHLQISPNQPVYNDLLVILYDSYMKQKEKEKQKAVLSRIQQSSPQLAEKIELYTRIATVNLNADTAPHGFQTAFRTQCKSPTKAGSFNAILPGLGYLYVGQKQTAVTSFLINGLFIAAAYQFFHHGQSAAGIITSGFELGWYVGGIQGAHDAALQYNTALYNRLATDTLKEQKLFPIFMLNYSF